MRQIKFLKTPLTRQVSEEVQIERSGEEKLWVQLLRLTMMEGKNKEDNIDLVEEERGVSTGRQHQRMGE